MKKVSLALIAFLTCNILFAQQQQQAASDPSQNEAPYKKFPTVPPFHLLKVDSSTYLTKDDIKKHHPTLVMFFSPDCDHCKHQTESMLSNYKKFRNVEIVMATYQPFGEMKEFNTKFQLAKYPNIKIGRDEKFFLAPFYRIRNLPYLALYDKDGNLITTFEGTTDVDKLTKAFNIK